jgi:hypothetical protein
MRAVVGLGSRTDSNCGEKMSTITELRQTLRNLSAAELESIADWLEWQVEESRYRAFHVREAQPGYVSEEEPLFMTWEEYLAFEEKSSYRHEYVNGTVYAMGGASLAHNRDPLEIDATQRPAREGDDLSARRGNRGIRGDRAASAQDNRPPQRGRLAPGALLDHGRASRVPLDRFAPSFGTDLSGVLARMIATTLLPRSDPQ